MTYGISIFESYSGAGLHYHQVVLLRDENVQYFFISILWVMTAPFWGTLVPFFIYSLLHSLAYTRAYLIPMFGSKHHHHHFSSSSSSPLASTINTFIALYNGPLMTIASHAEVFILVRLVAYSLTFNFEYMIQLAVYFFFFKAKYNTSPLTRHAVKTWEITIDRLMDNQMIPTVVPQAWLGVKRTLQGTVGQMLNLGGHHTIHTAFSGFNSTKLR